MLPESLKSSYAQYKDDTDRFATWLLAAAEKCGYQSNLGLAGDAANGVNGSTKAKRKAKAKSAPILPLKYKATISELRTLGEVVAKSSLKIPDSILRRGPPSRCAEEERHALISRERRFCVLEEICESLEWRANGSSPNQGTDSSSTTGAPSNGKTDPKAADEAWINQFATLTVEEPENVLEQNDSSKQLVRVEVVQDDDMDNRDPEQ
ncbi:hypothetical protein Daus18300_012132 [Diaporthe australafricana]|uniref:DUF6604 domain-containing protein n=1 Tax=Diaporthe australafricana TaxID=127596 RepID=A0ABR3W3Z1_9PEZI